MNHPNLTTLIDRLEKHSGFRWLDVEDQATVEDVLRRLGWIRGADHVIKVAYGGEGNMNLVLRVSVKEQRGERTLILKQGRPWVEKYPEIAAPWERVEHEWQVYQQVRLIEGVGDSIAGVIGFDSDLRLLALEDVGEGVGIDQFYEGHRLKRDDLDWLASFMHRLHRHPVDKESRELLRNEEMRQLNHEYIFVQPLDRQRAIDERLDRYEKGLIDVVQDLRRDEPLREAVRELGEIYMSDEAGVNDVLLHGDYYPGSWHWPIKKGKGRRVILDWEFSFFGKRHFDVGVFIAHMAIAKQEPMVIDAFLEKYDWEIDSITSGFAGNEVIRRLAGVAQLPIAVTNGWRTMMLENARQAVVRGDWRELWRVK